MLADRHAVDLERQDRLDLQILRQALRFGSVLLGQCGAQPVHRDADGVEELLGRCRASAAQLRRTVAQKGVLLWIEISVGQLACRQRLVA